MCNSFLLHSPEWLASVSDDTLVHVQDVLNNTTVYVDTCLILSFSPDVFFLTHKLWWTLLFIHDWIYSLQGRDLKKLVQYQCFARLCLYLHPLAHPRCGLSIWLSLLAIFNTLFWVYANFVHEKMDKTQIIKVRIQKLLGKQSILMRGLL